MSTSSTSSPPATTTGSSDSGASTSSGTDCEQPALVETFDGAWDEAQWEVADAPGRTVTVTDGALAIVVDDTAVAGYAGLISSMSFQLGSVELTVELLEVIGPEPNETETLLFVQDAELTSRVGFAVYDSGLQALVTDPVRGPTSVAVQPYDPLAHRWLRIHSGPESTEFWTSSDGADWKHFGSGPTPTQGAEATFVSLQAGIWQPVQDAVGETRLDNVVACSSQ